MRFPPLNIPNLSQFFPRFGDLLRDHRTVRGLTIEDVATAAGIAPAALREMETGARPAPSRKLVRALADAMDLDGEDRRTLVDAAELTTSPVRAALGQDTHEERATAPAAAIFVFLIADIRGYTSFTERHGDEAAARLTTRFAEIARAVMERWEGRLVELRGDEALGAFASARQAVRAAGDLHARYSEAVSERPELPPGIGIGLDIGEAIPVENGYRGVALNRAARLCSLAGPGETLVSPGVFYVAPHVEGVRFIPRGQEQLKGFPEPVAILQAAPAEIVDATTTPPDDEE